MAMDDDFNDLRTEYTTMLQNQLAKGNKPPALFDLTTLQREANRRCGFTDQQTLDSLKKNNKNITMLTLEKLCTIIGCTPNDIVEFK